VATNGKEQKREEAKKKQPKTRTGKGKQRKPRTEPSRARETNTGLLSVGDIGKIAGVPGNTVQHWKYRDPSFPDPVSSPTSGDLYRRGEVMSWLRKTGRA
jgi:hypothetical protein